MSDPRTGGVTEAPTEARFSWRIKSCLSGNSRQPSSTDGGSYGSAEQTDIFMASKISSKRRTHTAVNYIDRAATKSMP